MIQGQNKYFGKMFVCTFTNSLLQLDFSLAAAPSFFAKSAAVYNPIIYIGMNRQV